jgi:hypothetical protein
VLHAADAAWLTRTILNDENFTWAFHWLAASKRQAIATRRKLHQVTRCMPEIELITSHCPCVAEHWNFDQQLQSIALETSGT